MHLARWLFQIGTNFADQYDRDETQWLHMRKLNDETRQVWLWAISDSSPDPDPCC